MSSCLSINSWVPVGPLLWKRIFALHMVLVSLPYAFTHDRKVCLYGVHLGEWRARLWNIPNGYDWVQACKESPVRIGGVLYDTWDFIQPIRLPQLFMFNFSEDRMIATTKGFWAVSLGNGMSVVLKTPIACHIGVIWVMMDVGNLASIVGGLASGKRLQEFILSFSIRSSFSLF